jgi:LysM repeat protein/ABC-type branched-subunit amino acid transport system substrate-binding protein
MINKFFYILILILFSYEGKCQQNIRISEEIIEINSRTYYVHMVDQGQTLYSLSKAYQVAQEEILAANQMNSTSLKVGQKVLIPKSITQQIQNNEYIFHEVVNGETLYGLAQNYEVEIQDIIKLNPEARNGIKSGQILRIKNIHYGEYSTINEQEYYYHIVKKDNTLYSISKEYEITIEDIILFNPEVKNGLVEGQRIRLPKNKIKINSNNNQINGTDYSGLYFEEEGIPPCKDFTYLKDKVFEVVLMLPLYLEKNIYYLENYKSEKDQLFYKNSQRFIEIYEGALIALNRLKSEGFSVNFRVIDTNNEEQVINEFISTCNPKKIDLIIGPIYSGNLKTVSNFALENRINIVSPLSSEKELTQNNPFLFQVIPSTETVIKNTAETLINNRDSSIIFIHMGSEEEFKYINLFQEQLKQSDSLSEYQPEIKTVNFKTDGITGLENAFSSGLTNTVIISSVDEVFISQLLDIMERISKLQKIRLYVPQKTENFQNTTFNHLSKLNVHYITPTYIDYTRQETQSFIDDYRSVFHTEPSLYSFEGYDIVYYFLNALRKYGRHFQFCLQEDSDLSNKKGLVFNFSFKRVNNTGGFENTESFILKYNEEYKLIDTKKTNGNQ